MTGDHLRVLSDAERLDWLRLIRSEGIGPRHFAMLIERFGDAAAALDALPDIARRGGRRRPLGIASRADAEAELDAAAAAGARAIALCEPDYPAPLAAIADAPPLLYVRGAPDVLAKPAVAVVGARNASANGRGFARDIARDLGEAGFTVVSGLARGIDAAAHGGALATGTAAVVAGGIDVVYPPEHADLTARIAADGAVVSEQPPGTTPTARHFPARNRLISGLSAGTLVVEAAARSGSLITARMALEQGREVFAVPGSPRDPRCAGTNDLIRQGAVLTSSAADVIEALRGQIPPTRNFAPSSDLPEPVENVDETDSADAHARLLGLLGPTPTGVDELVRECQMSAPAVQTVLLELELAGRVERHPGNRVSLIT